MGCETFGLASIYWLESQAITMTPVILGLLAGLAAGLLVIFGNYAELLTPHLGGTHIQPAEYVTWSWEHTWHDLTENGKKGITIIVAISLPMILILGCASSIFHGPLYGLHYGLVYGSIVGIVNGIAATLAGIINSGWSSTTIDEHDFTRPNEGIHHSGRHAFLAAGIFGTIGGIISGVICGCAFFLGGVPGWFTLLLGFTLVCSIIFAFRFWIAYGGAAVIEHYALRWHLSRMGIMPLHYIPFLNYATQRALLCKVGGGYMFTHQLLLEYFANIEQAPLLRQKKRNGN